MKLLRKCPICNHQSRQLSSWGGYGYHVFDRIAGIQVDWAKEPYTLSKCLNCSYIFKTSRLSEAELLDIYSKFTERTSGCPGTTNVSERLKNLASFSEEVALMHSFGRRVLDIGCSNGAMLQLWGPDWIKSGIEPSTTSADEANQRGIDIVASSINLLESGLWDCIISVDTIEHINDPMAFFASVKNFLTPGGVVITLSGDMSYGLASLAGPRYWYSSFPEHVGFLLPATYSYIAKKLNGRIVFSRRYSWRAPGCFNALRFFLQLIKYMALFLVISVSRLFGLNTPIAKRPFPVMDSHFDHLVTVMGRFD